MGFWIYEVVAVKYVGIYGGKTLKLWCDISLVKNKESEPVAFEIKPNAS